jgi:MFS family permease
MKAVVRQVRRIGALGKNAKLFLAMTAVSALGGSIFRLFLNLFILARGNDEAFLGLFMSLVSISALGLGLPMGVVADRLSRKQSLLLGSVLSALGMLAVVLSPGDWPLMAGAVAWGGGNAVYMATGPAFMAESSTAGERSTLFSTQRGLMMMVGFAGSVIGGPLPSLFGSMLGRAAESAAAYRATLLISAAITLLSLIPLSMLRERSEPAADPVEGLGFSLRSLMRRDVWRLLLPQLVLSLGAGLLIPYLNVFFKQRFAISDSLLGFSFGVSQLGMGLATTFAPIFAERWGKVRTIVASELASLPFLLTLGFVPVLPVAIGAFWIRATLMNMGGPLYTAFAMEQAREEERGKLGALLGVVWSVGRGIGPGISGLVQQRFGFAPLFLTTGGTYLAAAVLLGTFFGPEARETEAGSLAASAGGRPRTSG